MDYEEYMKSVLGYSQIPNNIYNNTYDNYYDIDYYDRGANNSLNKVTTEMLEPMYPEIYRMVYPMIIKRCSQNNKDITNQLIDKMTEEIYSNDEPEDTQPILKNGDVRNPKSKEPETRQCSNQLLKDLIKILILREFGKPTKPPRPMPPPRPPRPPYNQRPPWDRY